MNRFPWLPMLAMTGLLAMASAAQGQSTPYIGYVYPAGGQQGTTFQVKVGGQRLDGLHDIAVTGEGVSVKLIHYYRTLSPQEITLLREQRTILLQQQRAAAKKAAEAQKAAGKNKTAQKGKPAAQKGKPTQKDKQAQELLEKIEYRIAQWVNRPACSALANIALLEVTIAPNAKPGPREIRLVALRGTTNPMVFHVGQVPEVSRKAMKTCFAQVLGKEASAQRKRPDDEVEERITLPCTMNGQIASGEVNRYRFEATKGQRLVVSVDARQLIPYVADAVPGWFQPIVAMYDADGKEVAFSDDFRFKPDPTFYFEVPKDGEYVLAVTDAIYRGREDFVYRMTVGEMPFVTSIFPLGGRVGEPVAIEMDGWNLEKTKLAPPPADAKAGVHQLVASKAAPGKKGFLSNRVPFALDTLPECLDKEANDNASQAQKVKLPIIVNGRVDRPDDWDVFQVEGRAGQTLVAEVHARRLDSPLDSMLKITDSSGKVLAFNDDYEDAGSGLNTHHADSYLMFKLPADGTYYVHLGDTARAGGKAYAYRLRISKPRPDFALRVVSSSAIIRSKAAVALNVFAIRKDGFTGPIRLSLKSPPAGFTSSIATLPASQDKGRFVIKTSLTTTKQPVSLTAVGSAMIQDQIVAHEAVPAEDRMQAFLWRHFVPAEELAALVYNPGYKPEPKRVCNPSPAAQKKPAATATAAKSAPPKFNKRQVASRLRQLGLLFEEWLLTDDFYDMKVKECESYID